MDKKLIYIGIGLFVLAILLLLAAPSIVFHFNTTTLNSTIQPGQMLTYPIILAKPSVLLIVYQATHGVNFYLMNAFAYGAIKSAQNASSSALANEGRGTIEIANNFSSGAYPREFTNSSQGYFYRNSTILPAGTYYVLFQNAASNSTYIEYQINVNSSISGNLLPIALLGLIFIAALVGAIIAIGYGFVKKADAKKSANDEAKIQSAYDQIEKEHGHVSTSKKKSAKKGK